MYQQIAICGPTIPNFQLNRLITLCANSFDDRVALKYGGDAKHVPGTVSIVGLAVGMDFEVRRNG